MTRGYLFLAVFFIILFSLSHVSSNFVCGFVNDSQNFSSSWSKVIIYPDENHSKIIQCEINPENKFCCDTEELPAFNYSVGKKIFAEVFDQDAGFVAGPVNLYLTGEGYDLFPQMNLQKAITINSPIEKIFVNQSSIILNIALAEHYNNLKYSLNSSEGFSEGNICTNCTTVEFPMSLDKGKNEIIFTAYGPREISEKIIFYNLDYLNFNLEVFCKKCKIKPNYFYVPSNENIIFSSSFNASHNISGEFLFYFPSDWKFFNYFITKDFSSTHNILTENITNRMEFTANYTLKSPETFIKQEYPFYQRIENKESINKVLLFRFKFIPFHKTNHFAKGYFNFPVVQMGSQDHPIILHSTEDYLKTVAIFPKKQIFNSYSYLEFETKKSAKKEENSFKILTNLPPGDIDKIFLVFKVEKKKSINVFSGEKEIPLTFYEQDENYFYYFAYVNEKGPFTVKIF